MRKHSNPSTAIGREIKVIKQSLREFISKNDITLTKRQKSKIDGIIRKLQRLEFQLEQPKKETVQCIKKPNYSTMDSSD